MASAVKPREVPRRTGPVCAPRCLLYRLKKNLAFPLFGRPREPLSGLQYFCSMGAGFCNFVFISMGELRTVLRRLQTHADRSAKSRALWAWKVTSGNGPERFDVNSAPCKDAAWSVANDRKPGCERRRALAGSPLHELSRWKSPVHCVPDDEDGPSTSPLLPGAASPSSSFPRLAPARPLTRPPWRSCPGREGPASVLRRPVEAARCRAGEGKAGDGGGWGGGAEPPRWRAAEGSGGGTPHVDTGVPVCWRRACLRAGGGCPRGDPAPSPIARGQPLGR